MNLQAIITTNMMGCAILVILLISSYVVRQRRQLSDKIFTAVTILTISACAVEAFDFMIDGRTFFGARPISLLCNTYLYAVNLLVSFSWCVYTDLRLYGDDKRIKKYYPYLAIPLVAAAVALLPNLKWQFFFSIDSSNVYQRETAGYIFYLITVFYLGTSVRIKAGYNKKFGKTGFFPVWMFLTPIIIGTAAQLMVYGISLAWASVSLGLVGVYMCLQNEISYLDPLTKIYNRNYLDQAMRSIERRTTATGGIMIDIDDFKSINDLYGHSTGDDALVDAARILRTALPDKAILIRFAGDEFIILIRTDSERELTIYTDDIRRELESFNNSSNRSYTLSFSIGYSFFYPGGSADMFLKAMDENMYIEKNTKHYSRHHGYGERSNEKNQKNFEKAIDKA